MLALVDVISADPPRGLGLRYDHSITRNARETLVIGRGNCVSLASVLVGLGRGLGWSVYYGEARTRKPERRVERDLAVSVDHMVVVLAPKAVRAVVDFSGPVTNRAGVREIDDLRAYAHLVNNRASEIVLAPRSAGGAPAWEQALAGFELATRIEPDFAQAWNNRGVALTRLGRLEEAQAAYARAVALDANLESSARNLTVLETRARGGAGLETFPDP